MKTVYHMTIAGFDIKLDQYGRERYAVMYGAQYQENLSYTEAATQLGVAIMHGLICEGKMDP